MKCALELRQSPLWLKVDETPAFISPASGLSLFHGAHDT